MMSLHHARSLARIYSRTWVVTMVMNIAIYALALLQVQKIRKDRQHSPVLVWLSLCKPFKGMRVFNCNWIRKIKYFSIFFLRFSLRSSLKRLEPYHYYFLSLRHLSNFQPSDQTIFLGQASRLGHETRPHQQPIRWSAPDQTTTSDNRTSLRSNHTMHQLPHQTIVRPDHQNQPIRSDHHRHTRPPESAQQTPSREMVQVRCIVCGLGIGGYIELWMNLAKHTFHTRSASSFRTSFFGLT